MLVRDIGGNIQIIARKDYASEKTYNRKIYTIMLNYTKYKNSCFVVSCNNMCRKPIKYNYDTLEE